MRKQGDWLDGAHVLDGDLHPGGTAAALTGELEDAGITALDRFDTGGPVPPETLG